MSKILFAVLCCMALSGPAMADTCLNTDKEKYADNDVRSFDYGKCKPSGPDNSYNSLNVIGKQMEGMFQRNDPSDSRREMSDSERTSLYAGDRAAYANARFAMRCEVQACVKRPSPYPNASATPAQQEAIREEIRTASAQGKLLETYSTDSFAKKWVGGGDQLANWKMCEVSASLIRAYVYGDGVSAAQKDPARGFAIARVGCDASCGEACFELGRILVAGDAAAPGVDRYLGKEPQDKTLFAFETAARNGITAAFEHLAELNREMPERYKGKTYFKLAEMDTYSYWINSYSDTRLSYRQYQKCLKAEPSNLTCARGINLLLKSTTPGSDTLWKLNGDITERDVAFYREYLQKLEGLLSSATPAGTSPP